MPSWTALESFKNLHLTKMSQNLSLRTKYSNLTCAVQLLVHMRKN